MRLGLIGLGHMGFPMARRLLEAGHTVTVYDTCEEAVNAAADLGAQPATAPREVADVADTVLASLPSAQACLEVVDGAHGVAQGTRIARFVDLSTVGSEASRAVHRVLRTRGIAALDSPVSGGVAGAQNGTLTLMVSGPHAEFDSLKPLFDTLGRAIYVGDKPGSAQTMKLLNNLVAATALAVTSEVVAMGVKAGLDPQVIVDVLNAGSGGTHASRDKFPRSILPRTFDYGFATGLMVKDVRLYLEEAARLEAVGVIAAAVAEQWETTLREEGADSDFTSVIKPIEAAAGVVVDGR
ncbi:NAD(P)-dependent oxidoreductase [Mycolicibacterium holsaticum]|uniref:NAD(P)-dependent oxidoreductase n=1 Tax=Mycolicibacterium holsaticum TaxID=152142 RepID=UPI001C7D8600|nr:NAD(P)-dependent oxidoreductase [Mycolicibacterium holsaticum]MDA4107294.1 oxidoreductase [Mycolicibacterium holsaticum DSM 44478 = JCM 12374]QZA14113.1 NAD(P)-dependent oxidoreductase [Mycolicibacterium holsaticum DSM 44478 = JCM 12374]UNC08432.1 NAD(P)-dependent oxidoreductase [Mycolicibacterium holsaticum DSM 44478 = JCM 12374]